MSTLAKLIIILLLLFILYQIIMCLLGESGTLVHTDYSAAVKAGNDAICAAKNVLIPCK